MKYPYFHTRKKHHNIALTFLTLIFCTFFYNSFANEGKYPIQNFSPSEYKAGIQNIDFAQNRDMRLFIANNLGVLTFNGKDWEVHAYQSGKKQRSLAFDEEVNRLYIGSQGDFGYFDEKWKYVSLYDLIPNAARDFDEVWDVFISKSKVYFCTFQHLYIYDGENIKIVNKEGGFDRSFLVQGKVLTQDHHGHLYEVSENGLIDINISAPKDQIIAGIIPIQSGYLIIYKSGKVGQSSTLLANPSHEQIEEALIGAYVNHVLPLSDNRIAICTQTAGLFFYDLQTSEIEHLTTRDGLQSNACLRAFQDFNGNLWLGLQNGISLLQINSPMRIMNKEIDLQGSGYEVFNREEGNYYSTSNGFYFLSKSAERAEFIPGTEGPAYGFQELAGNLYGGHNNGLYLLKGLTATRIANTDGMWIVKPLQVNEGFAIGGTYSGLHLFKFNANKLLESIGPIDGFNESSRFFEEDDQGRILVGQYYKGLFQLNLSEDLKSVKVDKLAEGDLKIQEKIILAKVDDQLLLATNEGIFKIDPVSHKIIKAPIFYGLIGDQPVHLIKQDRQKNIHIIAENTVGFFKQISPNNYVFVPSALYQFRYQLNNDLLNTSINLDEGVAYAANEGFLHYNPNLEERLGFKNPLVVDKLYNVNQASNIYDLNPFEMRPMEGEKIEINQKAKILQFHVESFQFHNENDQSFRYKLEGFEKEYGEWTNSTMKEYTNLKEGNYSFIAQSKNYLGEITTSLPLQIYVKPPFYRSNIAKLIYALLALLFLYYLYRLPKRKFEEKEKILKDEIKGELQAKDEKLDKIKEEKESEVLQLKEEKMQNEVRHLNNLLAASTMNLVVKNDFIEKIKGELKTLRNEDENEGTKKSLKKIEKEIDLNLRIQEDWKQFELHFDQVHGDFLGRLRTEFAELSPNEQRLCAFLRLNLSTKEIAKLMIISSRGVEIARYRLRKKLGLQKGQNLSKFLLEY